MKILNLYCGIGGNRKMWGNEHQITAIENKAEIAKIYADFFPNDKVIVADAHKYLLEHYEEFDFIWSSPPCPTHSRARYAIACSEYGKEKGVHKPIFPNMKLYEEIIFLQGYFKGKYVVENVLPWYKPLIPAQQIGSHLFWMNFYVPDISNGCREHNGTIDVLEKRKGLSLKDYNGIDKRLALRNCVEPEIGKQILEYAINPIEKQKKLL